MRGLIVRCLVPCVLLLLSCKTSRQIDTYKTTVDLGLQHHFTSKIQHMKLDDTLLICQYDTGQQTFLPSWMAINHKSVNHQVKVNDTTTTAAVHTDNESLSVERDAKPIEVNLSSLKSIFSFLMYAVVVVITIIIVRKFT